MMRESNRTNYIQIFDLTYLLLSHITSISQSMLEQAYAGDIDQLITLVNKREELIIFLDNMMTRIRVIPEKINPDLFYQYEKDYQTLMVATDLSIEAIQKNDNIIESHLEENKITTLALISKIAKTRNALSGYNRS